MRQYFIDQAAEVDPREEKLPVWARDKLATLRRAATDALSELRDFKEGREATQLWIESTEDNSRFYLPPRSQVCWGDPGGEARVTFGEPGKQYPAGWFAVRGALNLHLAPWCANVALVRDSSEAL